MQEALPHATHVSTVDLLEFYGLRILCYPWMWGFRSSLKPYIAWMTQQKNIDIIISHSPQSGVLDFCHSGSHGGSYELNNVIKMCKPLLHLCGHVHEASGHQYNEKTGLWSVNSAIVDHPVRRISKLGHVIEIELGDESRKNQVVNVQRIELSTTASSYDDDQDSNSELA